MADIYGNIVTTSDAERFLKEMNRDYYGRKTWEQAFGNVNLAEQQQIGTLDYDYSKAIGEAYAAAYKNQRSIMNSNLGQGYKEQAMISNEEALNQAFETYRQKYLSGVSQVETEANKVRTELGEQLNTQAINVAKFMNSPFGSDDEQGYIQWLFGQAETDKELNKYLEGNPAFERYFKESDNGKVLKDSYELRQLLRDKQGYLLNGATNIYDQLFNLGTTVGDKYSFGRWLSETDKDLYDWATKSDMYNFTAAGTNFGTVKELVGMKSTDEVYDYIDTITGLDKEQLTELSNKFTKNANKINELLSVDKNGNSVYSAEQIEQGLNNVISDIEILTEQIGLNEYAKSKGIDVDLMMNNLKNEIKPLIKELNKADNESIEHIFDIDAEELAAAALTGAAGGTGILPGVGTVTGAAAVTLAYIFIKIVKNVITEPGSGKRSQSSRDKFNTSAVLLVNTLNELQYELQSY